MENILYLGDTNLQTAACYLAGLISHWGWSFDYVPSDQEAKADLFEPKRALFVLSDYPAQRLSAQLQMRLLEQVEAGAGLLMCGGWESYHGVGGDWDGTEIGNTLPVEIADKDDRVNCDHPVLVKCPPGVQDHPIVSDLPWSTRAPLIGGFNRITPRSDATVLLEARHFSASCADEGFAFKPTETDALLVVGSHGSGRTAALATDVAPHWVGPLVDWGQGDEPRVTGQAAGGEAIEVGNLYAQFFKQLLGWTGGAI